MIQFLSILIDLQNACPRNRYRYFRRNSTDMNPPRVLLTDAASVAVFIHTLLCKTCEHFQFFDFFVLRVITSFGNFQKACPRKCYSQCHWYSSELNSARVQLINAVSVAILISTLLCMTCEHLLFSTFVSVMRFNEKSRFSKCMSAKAVSPFFLKLHWIALMSCTTDWCRFSPSTHFYTTLHDVWTSMFLRLLLLLWDITNLVDFQNACPRKWFDHFFWNSNQLNSRVLMPIDVVSGLVLISTLLCMTCEHRLFSMLPPCIIVHRSIFKIGSQSLKIEFELFFFCIDGIMFESGYHIFEGHRRDSNIIKNVSAYVFRWKKHVKVTFLVETNLFKWRNFFGRNVSSFCS